MPRTLKRKKEFVDPTANGGRVSTYEKLLINMSLQEMIKRANGVI